MSCLCVTEAREPFHPWLLWNYEKQDYPLRELIVVDSGPLEAAWPDGTTVIRCPPGTAVGRKRNLALDAARGDVVAWFDDDDWQHPRRLSLLVSALERGHTVAGAQRSWFVDVARGRARAYTAQRGVIFNGLAVRRPAAVRFDERRPRAADTAWMTALYRETRCTPEPLNEMLSFWLCHHSNLSNKAGRYLFTQSLEAVRADVGPHAWDDTDTHLSTLCERLMVNV